MVDFETTVRSIPDEDRTASSDASYIPSPTTYEDVDASSIFQRLRGHRRPEKRKGCNDSPTEVAHQPGPPDDESPPGPPDTPTPAPSAARRRRSKRIRGEPPSEGGDQEAGEGAGAAEAVGQVVAATWRDRPYCTQKCLLGLARGRKLDASCPNVGSHRRDGGFHPVKHGQWLDMLRQQLERSLDDGITPLGLGGARSVLFKVTMLAYGYTFVSKGTVRAFIPDLQHEADVYQRLLPAQGRHVPVFLGAVDLRAMNKIYYYDHRVYVVYMAFLSWGGCSLWDARAAGVASDELRRMAVRSQQAVHREGVRHEDVREANMLFHEETKSVMMIDFERAKMSDVPREAPAPVVQNKRQRTGEGEQRTQGMKAAAMNKRAFAIEALELKGIFNGVHCN